MPAFFSFQAYVYRGQGNPLGCSLEQIVEPMQALSGLFFEWDGSLTWANQAEGWQIDGMVYDDGKQVQYVHLHGRTDQATNAKRLLERLNELFATWFSSAEEGSELMLMRLPDRRWQSLHDFEKELLDAVKNAAS